MYFDAINDLGVRWSGEHMNLVSQVMECSGEVMYVYALSARIGITSVG